MGNSHPGKSQRRYQLVPRVLIFITRREEILLIKGAPDKKLWANQYNGLGGHVERGEDVFSAARRELKEESGLSSADLWLCAIITIDTGEEAGISMHVYRGENVSGQLTASAEGSLEWLPVADLGDLPLVEDLPKLLPLVLAMQPGDAPLSLHYSYASDGELIMTVGD